MSKVVRSVGRSIGGVVKGVTKAVKGVAKSKLGKVILIAAAVYFGGAAMLGASGSSGVAAAQGLSGLKGAMANVGAAWSSLGTAGSAIASGEFGAAGKAISSGFTGTAATGATTGITSGMTQAQMLSAQNAGIQGATQLTNEAAKTAFANEAGKAGLQLTQQAAGGGISEGLIGAAKINAGAQLAGGLIQGAGQQKALSDQRKHEAEQAQAARDRYNSNVGTNWWDAPSSAEDAAAPPINAQAAPTGLVAGAMTPQQEYAERMRRQMQTYNPYAMPTRV